MYTTDNLPTEVSTAWGCILYRHVNRRRVAVILAALPSRIFISIEDNKTPCIYSLEEIPWFISEDFSLHLFFCNWARLHKWTAIAKPSAMVCIFRYPRRFVCAFSIFLATEKTGIGEFSNQRCILLRTKMSVPRKKENWESYKIFFEHWKRFSQLSAVMLRQYHVTHHICYIPELRGEGNLEKRRPLIRSLLLEHYVGRTIVDRSSRALLVV